MDKATRWLLAAAVVVATLGIGGAPASALTDTVATQVRATVPLRADVTLTRDDNSSTRGTAAQIIFDRYDDQDNQPDGSPFFMYAPYRSEGEKNWHLVNIAANGSGMTLTAAVSGQASGVALSEIMDVFTGGFFESDGNPKGGESSDWEILQGFRRELQEPFFGILPMNYRLRVRGVAAGTHTGNVTFTLVST